MDTLPLEAFQLICSFCSLHVLAQLRLVSRSFHDRVDGSLTARRTHAVPTKMITLKGKHDRDACYIRFTLFRQEDPITVVFNQYNPQHNYLEFVQRSEPVVINDSGRPVYPSAPESDTATSATSAAAGTYPDYALGKLDLNLWEQQRELVTSPTLPSQTVGVEDASPGTGSRARRSSITQASIIRGTENQIEQELASSGPVTPLARVRPTRHHGTSALGTSSGFSSGFSALLGASTPREAGGEGENHMMRFARMVLGITGTGSNSSQTRPGMSAAELAEEARRLIHTVEPEVLSSQKLYKFYFSEGVHYVGDSDFVMRYNITVGPAPSSRNKAATEPESDLLSSIEQGEEAAPVQHYQLLQVDYIRVSWKWITSGMPSNVQAKQSGSSNPEDLEDASVKCCPLPNLRIGRIYAARFNRILQEIKDKGVSQHIRAELAMQGYDVSILPRDFISVNLFADPVLAWITKDDRTINEVSSRRGRGDRAEASEGGKSVDRTSDGSVFDSDWEDLAPGEMQSKGKGKGKGKADGLGNEDHAEDQEQLDELMQTLRDNVGLLTARNILEEMLAMRGYSRELIWKYGIVRREMMGIVPEPTQAKQLLQKIIESESPSSRPWR